MTRLLVACLSDRPLHWSIPSATAFWWPNTLALLLSLLSQLARHPIVEKKSRFTVTHSFTNTACPIECTVFDLQAFTGARNKI